MKTSLSRQSGISALSMIALIVVVASAGTFGIKTVPAYLDFRTIDSTISSVLSDPKLGLKSANEIRDKIRKRWNINNVEVLSADDLVINKGGGTVNVQFDYSVRNHLVANIDLVMEFDKQYQESSR